jgi:CDP-diacylglycerol--glycerol-3-phosphate 3-phosphatidyltransferase
MYSFRPVDAGTLSALRSSRTLAAGTSLRVIAAPVVMALLLSSSYDAAAILFAVVAATDWFDGRLARRWGVASRFGAFLDTTADKVLVATALIGLVAVHRASPWVALIIIGREFTILGMRLAVVSEGRDFQTSMAGKWKATVQFAAIALAMLRPEVRFAGAYLDQWAMAGAALISIWSGLDYVARFGAALKA